MGLLKMPVEPMGATKIFNNPLEQKGITLYIQILSWDLGYVKENECF